MHPGCHRTPVTVYLRSRLGAANPTVAAGLRPEDSDKFTSFRFIRRRRRGLSAGSRSSLPTFADPATVTHRPSSSFRGGGAAPTPTPDQALLSHPTSYATICRRMEPYTVRFLCVYNRVHPTDQRLAHSDFNLSTNARMALIRLISAPRRKQVDRLTGSITKSYISSDCPMRLLRSILYNTEDQKRPGGVILRRSCSHYKQNTIDDHLPTCNA